MTIRMLNVNNTAVSAFAGPSDAGVETHQARRSYACAAGSFVDVPGDAVGDAAALANQGFIALGSSGTTSARPTANLKAGVWHIDSTLGFAVVFDGSNW